jgi:hypothetical protein
MSKSTSARVAPQAVPAVPYWRRTRSNGRPKRVGKFGVDLGERGVYDSRNRLNDLTGREWTYFLNSVWVTAFPPVADTFGFAVRKLHPCPKPPQLMRDIIQFFTKAGETILDPFAGVGGTLLGASLCTPPRHGVGVELVQSYVDAYHRAAELQNLPSETMLCGDSRNLLDFPEVRGQEFDLVLTDPPYSDMMTRPKLGQKKKLYALSEPSPFSESKLDLGNLPKGEFLLQLKGILEKGTSRLRDGRYLVVFCRDLQPTPEDPNLLHVDVVRSVCEIPGMVYRGMRIWHDQAADLYPFGYPYAFVPNQMHQYILVFRKEQSS